ncbi:uncharacterized protein EDB91DRAFT_1181790 [Suillus paluster]|uniref:uncharacterized protein n=1 Tax=Suillus paluster TaxID=48578 RepID=UPI001B85EFAD|nr:uncharacterized protein EDB91DRAFT_1181790 [Suillus paluster]KAG1719243.1 hypothetical protein EDB91DRAFT_1181790 [Suillus paluster]
MGGTNPISRSRGHDAARLHTGNGGIIPLQNITLLILAIIFSLLFIARFSMLNDIATNDPGVVLLGENVDIDIDEPAITVTWSIIACGDNIELNESSGIHESKCGLPSMYLQIYVDDSPEPAFLYDPTAIPFVRKTRIENLVRFDSDYTLDVHEARLYPFDSYVLSSTLRVLDASNATVPIRKVSTIEQSTSFLVASSDMDSYETTSNGTQVAAHDFDLRVTRPGQVKMFTLLLFGINWMLSHVTIGHVLLARRLVDIRSMTKHLISAFAILLVIPQLRNSMPDSPGFDDDYIGFFPQMIISASSVLIILLIIMLREYNEIENKRTLGRISPPPPPPPFTPRTPKLSSTPHTPAIPQRKSPMKPLLLGAKVRTRSDELNASIAFPPPPYAGGTLHHRSRSSRTRCGIIGLGGQLGSVHGPMSSGSTTTLKSVKGR